MIVFVSEALVKKEPLDPSLAALPESDLTVSNENMAVGHETVKCDLMPESVELVVTEQQEHGYAKPMVVLHTDKFEAPEVHQSTEQDEPVIAANAEPADQSQSGLDEMKRCSDNESMEQTAKAEHEAPESVGIVCAEDVDLNPANENFKKSQSPNINQTANEETIEETVRDDESLEIPRNCLKCLFPP